MTKFTSNGPIRLARRDVLMKGGAGVLGTMIAASTANIAGAQTPSADTVMANMKSIKMGDFNPNYANQWTFRLAQSLGFLEAGGIDDMGRHQSCVPLIVNCLGEGGGRRRDASASPPVVGASSWNDTLRSRERARLPTAPGSTLENPL